MHRVVVEISPTRVGAAVLRAGRDAERRCARLDASAESFRAAMSGARPALTQIIKDIGAMGLPALVVYTSPDAVAGVFTCPANAGMRSASQAATLALSESAGFPLDTNPHGLDCLSIDPRTGNEHAQIHTLGAADLEPNAESVAALATLAGVRVVSLVPSGAVLLTAAVRRAVTSSRDGRTVAVLQCGDHASVLAGASCGRVRFVRQISVGTETLVGAATRAATPAINESAAEALLLRLGVPSRSGPPDAETGVAPGALLPLIQPVLQRLIVEVRQSLRVGFDDREREAATLTVCGGLPRLGAVVGEQCSVTLAAEERHAEGSLGTLLAGGRPDLNLLPRSLAAERLAGRAARALKVGVFAAALFVGVDAALTRLDLADADRTERMLAGRLAGSGPAVALSRELRAMRDAVARGRDQLERSLGPAVDWDAALVMLSRTATAGVRLTSVRLECEDGRPVLRLEGFAPVGDNADASGAIKAYLDALGACPLVESCRLGGSQRGTERGSDAQRFDIELALVGLPGRERWAAGGEP